VILLVVLVVALGGLMHFARSFSTGDGTSSGTTLSFGYLLLTAFFVGTLFKQLKLPRLTGYLAVGVVAGPNVLDLVPHAAVDNLQLSTGVAVALIALTAGTELEFRAMRPLLRSIGWVTLIAIGGTVVLLTAVILLLRPLLPFMKEMSAAQSIAVAIVLGVVTVAQSPAVVVALRKETSSAGPVTSTVLGVVVIGDLVVILLFAVASMLAKSTFGEAAGAEETAKALAWELLGSLVIGLVVGMVLALYVKRVKASAGLFVLTTCFVVAEVGRRLHLDPLLVALAAGVFIRNVSSVGDELHHVIEDSSLPVYVLFFAVAGATIHLDVLATVGIPAVIVVLARGGGLLFGTRIAAKLAGAPESVQRWAGFGLLPQAGLALALSLLFAKLFPEFGEEAGALTLGVVAINEIVAPAVYRVALVRSGEAGKDLPAQSPAPEARATS
jgi:Kef-type K+ transport system membrane component KefB